MRSLFALFMVAALVLVQGTSLANSVCRHASIQAHIAARQSHDARKAAVAIAEDSADAAAAKKGSTSDTGSGSALSAFLTPSAPAAAPFPAERMLPRATDRPRLAGVSVRPPLPPPLA